MKKPSKTQTITMVLIFLYFIWEILIQQWVTKQPTSGGTIIRVDLIILYPILIVLTSISLYQYFKK